VPIILLVSFIRTQHDRELTTDDSELNLRLNQASRLVSYLNTHGLMPQLQSAYRRHHSTETALLNVLSDIYAAVDSQQVVLLGLLDLSAAFDSVDHEVLL